MPNPANLLPWLRPDPEPEPDPDPLAAAYARGQAHAEAKARRTLTEISVIAAARGRLIDPSDAAPMLDLDALDPDDEAGISEAITALLAERPHLGIPVEQDAPQDGNEWARGHFAALRHDPRLARLTKG